VPLRTLLIFVKTLKLHDPTWRFLERCLPFFKSNCLVVSSSPYNWLLTGSLFANNIGVFANFVD
jgi:hypothetical protein